MSGTSGTYTVTNTFLTPPNAADSEPNDFPSQALGLNPSGTSTGHIGFFGNRSYDLQDYWKITTSTDGWLRVQVRSDSLDLRGDTPLDLSVTLFDVDSVGFIKSDGRPGTFSEVSGFLRPGTYYVMYFTGQAAQGAIRSNQISSRRRWGMMSKETTRIKLLPVQSRMAPQQVTLDISHMEILIMMTSGSSQRQAMEK